MDVLFPVNKNEHPVIAAIKIKPDEIPQYFRNFFDFNIAMITSSSLMWRKIYYRYDGQYRSLATIDGSSNFPHCLRDTNCRIIKALHSQKNSWRARSQFLLINISGRLYLSPTQDVNKKDARKYQYAYPSWY
jgi:hypothetical protein